jgi:hypothetical protein
LDGGSASHKAATYIQNNTQISGPRVGFEAMTPVFEGAKTVHALDRATTVIGINSLVMTKNNESD